MKKYIALLTAVVLAATMGFCLTACGTSELIMNVNDEKSMTITAETADVDAFAMVGTLDVAEGEQIVVEPALDEGSVELEFISGEGMDDVEEVPDTDTEPQMVTEVSGSEMQIVGIPEGSYLVKAIVKEKATGSIEITVK